MTLPERRSFHSTPGNYPAHSRFDKFEEEEKKSGGRNSLKEVMTHNPGGI